MSTQQPKAYSYIRFSTPEQAEGDSERRQIKAAESYVNEEDIELVPLRDMGISGYSGKHISKGELGKFLSKIEKGEITPNSRLIIESVDRLTRLKPSDAQTLMINILEAHVSLVVLDYGVQEITLDKYNNEPGVFYQLMGELQRAYQEVKRKGDMISKARKNERAQAQNGKGKISGMPPMWLEFNDDKTEFKIKQEVADAINLMFQMKKNGKGAYRIERELNQMNDIYHPPKSKRNKSGAWRKSTINRYLKDRRLLGEYQPHKYINKDDGSRKRVEAGELIPDYYPQIVEPELFYKVQSVFEANSRKNGNSGGRTGKASNLFVHLVKCGACGDSMRYINKGKRQYLRCDDSLRELGCDEDTTARYDTIVQPLLLRYCRGLDVSDIMPGDEQRQSELAVLRNELQSVEGKLSNVKNKLNNLVDKIEEDEDSEDPLMQRYTTRKKQRDELQERQSELHKQIETLNNANRNTEKRLKDIQELIDRLGILEGQEQIDLRLNIRSKLQRLIERIEVGFGTLKEYGQPYTTFTIQFKDGVKRTLALIDDKLDEVITIDGDNIDAQNVIKDRPKETNKIVSRILNE